MSVRCRLLIGSLSNLPVTPQQPFGTSNIIQDVPVTKVFSYKERYRLSAFADICNAINPANLIGFTTAIGLAFGQPTARAAQTFLSVGPRAIQLGARFQFCRGPARSPHLSGIRDTPSLPRAGLGIL